MTFRYDVRRCFPWWNFWRLAAYEVFRVDNPGYAVGKFTFSAAQRFKRTINKLGGIH